MKQRIFLYALLLQVFYFILSLILILTCLREKNDFLAYFRVGQIFINDINGLYDPINYIDIWPFRYFPISAMLFLPFYLLGFDLGFVIFNIINVILNILISIILYKIITLIKRENHEKEEKRIILYISIFLISLPNLFNYILGQINLYITFFILLSLFLFLKYKGLKWDFISSFILGISVIIKPISIFMIPFLIVLKFNYKKKKYEFSLLKTFIRIIGGLIPLSLNFFFFLLYPELWEGFLKINFTSTEIIELNHSFSLSKLIVNFCIFYNIPYNTYVILIILLLFFSILGIILYVYRGEEQNSIILSYILGILIMLIVYFDSWDHHLLILTPMLIIIIFILPQNSVLTKKILKSSLIFFSFFDLAFMGIWFITKKFFPFNFMSTIFLILIFFTFFKISLKNFSKN